MTPDRRIIKFIGRHHVMTLATCAGEQPWCAHLFYAYIEELNCFVFTSDLSTRHGAEAAANSRVAASISLESKVVGKLQGLQVEGTVALAAHTRHASRARTAYLARFPYAVFAELELWILTPGLMKLTDNKLGFGKKLTWKGPH